MPAIEELLPVDQAAALEQLAARLRHAELSQVLAAARTRPAPAVLFLAEASGARPITRAHA